MVARWGLRWRLYRNSHRAVTSITESSAHWGRNLVGLQRTDVVIRADTLDLSDCSSLQSVTLNDARVRKLQFLSTTGRCVSSLQYLQLLNIRDLADIPGLDQLIGLEGLELSYCSIKELPDLQNLTKLQVLNLRGPFLKRKGGLEVTGGYIYCIPPQLRDLGFWWRLQSEPLNLSYGFERLQVLTIKFCNLYKCPSPGTTHLEGLGGLPALRRLSFIRCTIFSRLPDLSKSRNLEELTLWGCEMELCEEDIRMLASLPLLQPVEIDTSRRVKLDLARRKVLRLRSFEWKESDLGIPPINIGKSFLEDKVRTK
jgi:Leucine-rich repeat (LRR) protein